jgi:hypothetical protein
LKILNSKDVAENYIITWRDELNLSIALSTLLEHEKDKNGINTVKSFKYKSK